MNQGQTKSCCYRSIGELVDELYAISGERDRGEAESMTRWEIVIHTLNEICIADIKSISSLSESTR